MAKRIIVGLVALLCVALVLGAVGCGSKDKGNPEQTVKDFWAAVQQGDFAKAKTYFTSSADTSSLDEFTENSDPMTTAMMEAFMGAFDMEVTGSTVNGNNATVDVEVTIPDMDYVLDKLFASMGDDAMNMTEEQIMAKMAEELPKVIKDAPITTETDQVSLVWENDKWLIDEDPFSGLQGQL